MQYYRKTSIRDSLSGKPGEPDNRKGSGSPSRGGRDGRPPSGGPQKKPKRRLRIKKRFFVFAAAFLAVLFLICFGLVALFRSIFAGFYEVDYAMMESSLNASALILRDEQVIRSEGYGTVEYIALDGDMVQTGQPVLNFYSSSYTSDIATELTRENSRIDTQQKSVLYPALAQLVDSELDTREYNINQKRVQIREAIQQNPAALITLEAELETLIAERQAYLESTSLAKQNTTLTQMYSTRTTLLGRIEGWKSGYTSPMNGRVSYSFDGLEPYLTTEVLELLDASSVSEILRNNDPEQPAELRSQQALYRVVNPNHWYAIILTKDTDWTFGIGESCELYFERYNDLKYTATVITMSGSSDELMVVLEMNQDISSLLNARKLTAVIGGRVEGMRVPLSSIQNNAEVQGVYIYGSNEFVPVRVIGHDARYALVMPEEAGKITKGTRIVK